jgi:hypothetical protein
MSNHYRTSSHNHGPTDGSTANHRETLPCPSEIFACIDTDRILVTVAEYGWRTYIRRESPTEYTVRYENAAGVRSGTLTVNRREARRLVAEKCREAVWVDLQDRAEWPDEEIAEVSTRE